MTPELKDEKLSRLKLALARLEELAAVEPNAEAVAHERAAAMTLTEKTGVCRPLADRYVAEAVRARRESPANPAALLNDEALARVSRLDDKYGSAFMVLPHHVDQILKGGKHMSRRFRRWGDVGDIFHVRGHAFRFVRIDRLRVGDITDDDIRKEGYDSREAFEEMWYKSHPKSVKAGKRLEPDQLCWCHEYEPA